MAEFIPTGIGGLQARTTVKRNVVRDKAFGTPSYNRQEFYPPPRPRLNFIPSQEAIDALVERAVAALAKGIYWDRGSIINLVL